MGINNEREKEVKILGIDVEDMKKQILENGGIFIEEEYQKNTVVDSSQFNLIPEKSYLRIRTAVSGHNNIVHTLTYKRNIPNTEVRENQETTVYIDNPDAMITLLKKIGFDQFTTGEKKRIRYQLANGILEIDQWDEQTYPYPYMEIEVKSEEDLKHILEVLKIDSNQISLLSITELQEQLKKRR